MPWLLIPLFLFLILIVLIVFYFLIKKRSAKSLKQIPPHLIPPNATFDFIDLKKSPERNSLLVNELSALSQKNIKSLYFIHGTFVGNDPFHIISLIESALGNKLPKVISKAKEQITKTKDFIAGDFGNFTQKHLDLIAEVAPAELKAFNFSWSSANNHLARVKGVMELIFEIQKNNPSPTKILLIGHSHAGQLFALLSQMLHHIPFAETLCEKIQASNELKKTLKTQLKQLQKYEFIFVTMGTPVRYPWQNIKNATILHFINHRGKNPVGGELTTFLGTKHGDYIQQWACPGSDMLSPIKKERELNHKLDEILDIGCNKEQLRLNLTYKRRLHNEGHHYLVNYGDNSIAPNFLQTAFGHGIYSRMNLMGFHLHKINRHLANQ